MTKRMIDADALLELLKDNTELLTVGYDNAVDILIEKINELATPVPEPQSKKGE